MTDYETGMIIAYVSLCIFAALMLLPIITKIFKHFDKDTIQKPSIKINNDVKRYFDNKLNKTYISDDPVTNIKNTIEITLNHKLHHDYLPIISLYTKCFAAYYKETQHYNHELFNNEENMIICSAILTYTNLGDFTVGYKPELLIDIFRNLQSTSKPEALTHNFLIEFIIMIRCLYSLNALSKNSWDQIAEVTEYYRNDIIKMFIEHYKTHSIGDEDIIGNIAIFLASPDYTKIRNTIKE